MSEFLPSPESEKLNATPIDIQSRTQDTGHRTQDTEQADGTMNDIPLQASVDSIVEVSGPVPDMPEITKRLTSPKKAIYAMYRKYFREYAESVGIPYEDIEQEALLNIWEADMKITDMKNSGLWTGTVQAEETAYLLVSIRNAISAALRNWTGRNKYSDSIEQKQELNSSFDIPSTVSTEDRAIMNTITDAVLEVAINVLDDREKFILDLLLAGKRYNDISVAINLEISAVKDAVQRMIIKLRKCLGIDVKLPIYLFRTDKDPAGEARVPAVLKMKEYQERYYLENIERLRERARNNMRNKRAAAKAAQQNP